MTLDARDYLIDNKKDFKKAVKKLRPGDNLIMAEGKWNDFEIIFEGVGTREKPITLMSETSGRVILTGQSNLRIAGKHLVVKGLVFKDGFTPSGAVIEFRRNKEKLAYYSRVTETVIDNYNNPERFENDYWVAMYGKHNRFDHNHLEGKRNKGVTMAVRLNDKNSVKNHHRIDHNYFGPRQILGSNGGETLRIGTSHYSLSDSFSVVENNYFDRCDGELEIISNKSGGNVFRGNVFFESRGTLTMRHGNDNLVENNLFFGNNVEHTGGIRVINKNQTIRNNYLQGLAGYRFGGAMVVMNGVPNSPINRYHQVDGAIIENNTLIDSDHIQLGAGSDAERSAVPVNSTFKNNIIYHSRGESKITVYDDMSGIKFSDNLVKNVDNAQLEKGFNSAPFEMQVAKNKLLYPQGDDYKNIGVSRDLSAIGKSDTGVSWYSKPDSLIALGTGRSITVKPGLDTLATAVLDARSGDILNLADGTYTLSRVITIDKPLTIIANKKPVDKEHSVTINFERSTLFEIVDGGSLYLQGLKILGSRAPDNVGNSVIRTQRRAMLKNYSVFIDQCHVENLAINHSFDFLSVSKGSFADNIDLYDSTFINITGAVLKLDKESDDYGIYNAEYVTVINSKFTDIKGPLIDFYRGGTDESTFGPHFVMTNSELTNVGRGKRNKRSSALYLHGVQVTKVSNNKIIDSSAINIKHTVGEPQTLVTDNELMGTNGPTVEELNGGDPNSAIISNNRSN